MMQSSPPAGRRRELSRCFAVFLFGCGRSLAVAAHAALLKLLLVVLLILPCLWRLDSLSSSVCDAGSAATSLEPALAWA